MAGKTGSQGAEIGARYASALFDLAKEENARDGVEKDLIALGKTIVKSDDLQSLISSPVIPREEKQRAIVALLKAGGAHELSTNVAGLMAANGRLFALPAMVAAYVKMATEARGEVSAEAISAVALNEEQTKRLRAEIEASVGKAVNLETRIDPDLLGGLVVKVGSRMVDSSLRTKLTRLKMAMKEA